MAVVVWLLTLCVSGGSLQVGSCAMLRKENENDLHFRTKKTKIVVYARKKITILK
jgi:hypothetical protein